jgi:hypothetical protein
MDDFKPPPKIFANHVVRQMVDHMMGEGVLLDPSDYMVLRTAFRTLGGVWRSVSDGDLEHLDKLKNVVTTWAQMRQPRKEGDRVV